MHYLLHIGKFQVKYMTTNFREKNTVVYNLKRGIAIMLLRFRSCKELQETGKYRVLGT